VKAMILAAGLGTRLRPLTDVRPKPLVPIINQPIIEHTITYLKRYGYHRITVNTHHHASLMAEFLGGGSRPGLEIRLSHEPCILGTAGGVREVRGFWGDDTLLVINGDILTDVDLKEALAHHRASGATATLVLHSHPLYNQVLLDDAGMVRDISSDPGPRRLAFTGIHFMEPSLLEWVPAEGFADIVECYRRMIAGGERVAGHLSTGHRWRDIGTIESYMAANREYSPRRFLLGPGCLAAPSAMMSEWVVMGPGCRVGDGASVARSVLWEGVTVGEGVSITDSVVTSGRIVKSDLAKAAW
jgi:mannose-1-phosphate guanylyltransferase